MAGNRTQNFPQMDTPLVDTESGLLTDPSWIQFFITMYNRTGGLYGNDSSAFNYPTTYGTLGQYLTSSGGATSLTWTTPPPLITKVSQLVNDSGYITAVSLAAYATLASPTFTGVPLVPLATINDNSNQIASTKFVANQASTVLPLSDGAATIGTSLLYARSDHVHPSDSRDNRLDNGWMEVTQRGLSFTGNGYTADRWQVSATGTSITTTIGINIGTWPSRRTITTSAVTAINGTIDYVQKIESANSFDLSGQIVTVSFYGTKSSTAGVTQFSVLLSYPTAADNFTTVTLIAQVTPTLLPNNRYTATFTNLPANVINGLQVNIRATQAVAAGTMTFVMTAVKLEINTGPTVSNFVPIEQELIACQRYYNQVTLSMRGIHTAAAFFDCSFTFTPMRTVPTLTLVTAGASTNLLSQTPFASSTNSGRYEIWTAAAGDAYALNYIYSLSTEL